MTNEDKLKIIKDLYTTKILLFNWQEDSIRLKKSDLVKKLTEEGYEQDAGHEKEILEFIFKFLNDVSESIQTIDFYSDILKESKEIFGEELYQKIKREAELGKSWSNNQVTGIKSEVLTKRSGTDVFRILSYHGGYHIEYRDMEGKDNLLSLELTEDDIELMMESLLELRSRIQEVKK